MRLTYKLLLAMTLAVAVAGCVSGCVSDVANRYYAANQYDPVPESQVEVLWRRPHREFIVIADFQSRGESEEDMREKAAQIGAHAVIVARLGGRYSDSEEWAGRDRYQGTGSRITGTAIRYTGE